MAREADGRASGCPDTRHRSATHDHLGGEHAYQRAVPEVAVLVGPGSWMMQVKTPKGARWRDNAVPFVGIQGQIWTAL